MVKTRLNPFLAMDAYQGYNHDRNRTKLSIGVSFQGLSVLREMKRIYLYTWDNIEKIAFSGKTFSVSLKHRPTCVKLEFEELMPQMHSKLNLEKQGLKSPLEVDYSNFMQANY
ncbi:hypothetical protein ACTXT7_007120 [Hymenolepis weldensis]